MAIDLYELWGGRQPTTIGHGWSWLRDASPTHNSGAPSTIQMGLIGWVNYDTKRDINVMLRKTSPCGCIVDEDKEWGSLDWLGVSPFALEDKA